MVESLIGVQVGISAHSSPVGFSQRPLLDLLAAVERDLLGVGYHAGVHVPERSNIYIYLDYVGKSLHKSTNVDVIRLPPVVSLPVRLLRDHFTKLWRDRP